MDYTRTSLDDQEESIINYGVGDHCPPRLAISTALQIFVPNTFTAIVLIAIVARVAGQSADQLNWLVFAGLLACGTAMVIHSFRFGWFGAGRLVVSNFNIPLLAISTLALAEGGPGLLATLIVVSTALQFVFSFRLATFRRIFSPTMSGIVIMLVAVSIIPFILERTVEESTHGDLRLALLAGAVALAVGLFITLVARPKAQLYTVPAAIIAGILVAAPLGAYDFGEILEAPLFSMPDVVWHGFDLSLGLGFWTLLPVFLFVNLTAFVKAVGDMSIIDRTAHRKPKANDFRVIQKGLNAYGLTTMLTALLGTLPVTAPWSVTAVYVRITRVAAAEIGLYLGLLTIAAAFFAKLSAILIAIPITVVVAVYFILFGLLFIEGAKSVFEGGMDHRKAVIVGVSLMLGVSASPILGVIDELNLGLIANSTVNSITLGGGFALTISIISEIFAQKRDSIRTQLSSEALNQIDEFLAGFASRQEWPEEAETRLRAVGEEVVLSLINDSEDESSQNPRDMVVTAKSVEGFAELEVLTAAGDLSDHNIEDRIAYLNDESPIEAETSFSSRLLQHYASSVNHRKYIGIDIVTARVVATSA